jgi:Holliday junction DNA helicase RuvA
MIGRIAGVLLEKQAPDLLVDVGGVGYEIQAPLTAVFELPAPGAKVELFTHLVVREDAHLLYGFTRRSDRTLFRELIKVSGVGPKLALAILSGMDADGFARCVRDGDAAALVRLPGVGKRTADRLLVEMRDRLAGWQVDGLSVDAGAATLQSPAGGAQPEAEAALIALGYKPQEAARMVLAAGKSGAVTAEELIRAALKGTVK